MQLQWELGHLHSYLRFVQAPDSGQLFAPGPLKSLSQASRYELFDGVTWLDVALWNLKVPHQLDPT